MAKGAELTIQGTGEIETMQDGTRRYVHNLSDPSGWRGTLGVRVPRESLDLLKVGTRSMQDGQLWRVTEEFIRQVMTCGYTLPDPLPDLILRENVTRKLLNGSGLNFEDVQASVVWK